MSGSRLTRDRTIEEIEQELLSCPIRDGYVPNIRIRELIMRVCSRDRPETKEGKNEPYDLFTFMIRNETGKMIDCAVFRDLVDKFFCAIRVGEIIRINEVFARLQHQPNRGNVKFVLRLGAATVITHLSDSTDKMILKNMPLHNLPSGSNRNDTINGTAEDRPSSSAETLKRKSNGDEKIDVTAFILRLESQIENYNSAEKIIIFGYLDNLKYESNESNEAKKSHSFAAEMKKRKLNDNDKIDVTTFLLQVESQINNYDSSDKKIIFGYLQSLKSQFSECNKEKKSRSSGSSAINEIYRNR